MPKKKSAKRIRKPRAGKKGRRKAVHKSHGSLPDILKEVFSTKDRDKLLKKKPAKKAKLKFGSPEWREKYAPKKEHAKKVEPKPQQTKSEPKKAEAEKQQKPEKSGKRGGLFDVFGRHKPEKVVRPLPKRLPKEVVKELIASDVMTRHVLTVKDNDSLSYVVRLISENKISGAPVLDKNDNFVGVVSEPDIASYVGTQDLFEAQKNRMDKLKEAKVIQIMRRNPVTVFEYTPLHEVNDIMNRRRANRIVVVDNKKKAVGIISRRDVIRMLSKEMMKQIVHRSPHTERSEIDTDIDDLLDMVELKGSISVDEIQKKLKVAEDKIEEWADILEKHDLIEVVYSPIGKPTLRKKVVIDG